MSEFPDVRLGKKDRTIVPDAAIANDLSAAARKGALRRQYNHKLKRARARLLADDRYQAGDYQICPETGQIKLINKVGPTSSRQARHLSLRDYLTLTGLWVCFGVLLWRLCSIVQQVLRTPSMTATLTVCASEGLRWRLLGQCDGEMARSVEMVKTDRADSLHKVSILLIMCLLCLLPSAVHTWDALTNRSACSVPLL